MKEGETIRETILCYYTATGNSLSLARRIAEGLGEARILPISLFRAGVFKPDAGQIGIIFPIHAWGPPRTVEEFVANLDASGLEYIFAIACCGGTACNTLPALRRGLRARGGDLHAGFIVRSPGYVDVDSDSGQARMIQRVSDLSGPLPGIVSERFPEIIAAVKARTILKPERGALLGSAMGSFFHGMASKQFARMDVNYETAPSCDGCGVCAKVCPRENIAMEGGRPAWKHDCEICGACSTWCPRRAISQGTAVAAGGGHHPAVVMGDMVLR